ncbi:MULTISPECIES: holo-ACP synthase [unclassified Exiguobacterium]|uniref:holo-ACP synthase n=1 Tax=unclassified Exiguobacterium TaxID=2644629 RepID=UPI00103D2C02|nr:MULTISPECIES: holo-ACP synthase [unclassified Exiguobacterium]TCI70556.1 holo-ACP synthase [Exiguobacterium sp. IPCI3]TCI79439.1 holo-ACP synthase [Exiguobacterium sp. IPCH1]TCI82231.1 holo-ACP synthase [Exiguobacterium sp. IPBC4]
MIVGIGIDIVELERIARSIKNDRFVARLLTEAERALADAYPEQRRIEFVAGRFAAKEAYAKAVGTGIARGLSWQQIEILPDEAGRPHMTAPFSGRIHMSISHSEQYAVAQVIIEEGDHDVSSKLD